MTEKIAVHGLSALAFDRAIRETMAPALGDLQPLLADAIVMMVRRGRSLIEDVTAVEIEIDWPDGVPLDARRTICAQLKAELDRHSTQCGRKTSAALVDFFAETIRHACKAAATYAGQHRKSGRR